MSRMDEMGSWDYVVQYHQNVTCTDMVFYAKASPKTESDSVFIAEQEE